jgi:hypothetical protein
MVVVLPSTANRKCLYHSVCRANNEAAIHLIHGNPHAAIRGFRFALDWLRTGHQHHHQYDVDGSCFWSEQQLPQSGTRIDDVTPCYSGNNNPAGGSCRASSSPQETTTPTALFRLPFCSDDEQVSPFNLFCYYNRTMVVQEDESDDALLCMVILFNLAITYHHIGLTHPGHEESLRKALALYKMVLAATQQQNKNLPTGGHTNNNNDTVVRLLLLATFSNLGHIYSHFMETFEEKICQQQLYAVLMGTSLVLDAEEARKFMLNARQRPEGAPAA